MGSGYTESANHYFKGLEENPEAIWAEFNLSLSDPNSDDEGWRLRLEKIGREYRMSSRFCLMRILHKRALKIASENPSVIGQDSIFADENSFRVQVGQEWITFNDISIEHALALKPEENINYQKYFLHIAEPSTEAESTKLAWLIARAMQYIPSTLKKGKIPKKNLSPLTREEALYLSHSLRFSLSETQFFLLRVFSISDCSLRFSSAYDVIHAYGFLTGATNQKISFLQQQYDDFVMSHEKNGVSSRSGNWTQQTTNLLYERISTWKKDPSTQDEKFLTFMKKRAVGFHNCSHTARTIYRNLAAYAYYLYENIPEDDSQVVLTIQNLVTLGVESDTARNLFNSGRSIDRVCRDISDKLRKNNRSVSEPMATDWKATWAVLTLNNLGDLSAKANPVNTCRTRINDLLAGKTQVEKGDILFLIFHIFTVLWSKKTGGSPDIGTRINHFKYAASLALEYALLPDLYLAHLMESCFILSIIHAENLGTTPGIVYASVLDDLRRTRDRDPKHVSRRYTKEEKIDILLEYRQSDLSLRDYARSKHISEKTISQWQKDLMPDIARRKRH